MDKFGRIFSLVAWIGLGAGLVYIDGFSGLGFYLLASLSALFLNRLALSIFQLRFSYALMVFLPISVIFGALCMFIFAFVSGADAVTTIPRWIWYSTLIYSSSAVALTIRLSEL